MRHLSQTDGSDNMLAPMAASDAGESGLSTTDSAERTPFETAAAVNEPVESAPVESEDTDASKLMIIAIGVAAGCLLLMMAVLLLVNKLRKRREREQQNLPRLPTRSLPDASALTCDIGAQSTSNIQTTAKVPAREDRIRDKTAARKAPEAAVVPDRIPEMIALEAVASARQPDPDGLMHASHDSEIVSQGCVEHLEVRACGTGGASMGSSHEHRVSQELGEVLSVNLSENQTHGPEHLYCEEQQSGSWNLSAFDEAAAQMQGSETSPHLTSALNDDYEYSLPANLKLVAGSGGSGEEGGEKLNTAFERRVLRRLERFLNNLPAPEKEAAVTTSSTVASVDAELSGQQNSDTASTGDKSITFGLKQPSSLSTTATINSRQSTAPMPTPEGEGTSSAAPQITPAKPSDRLHRWSSEQPGAQNRVTWEEPTFKPRYPAFDSTQPGSSTPKSTARLLIESSGMAGQVEAASASKRACIPQRPFRLLPSLEERASQESLSFSASATLSCSTAQSLPGAPDKAGHSGSVKAAHSGSIKEGSAAQHPAYGAVLPYVPIKVPSSSGRSLDYPQRHQIVITASDSAAPSSFNYLLPGESPESISSSAPRSESSIYSTATSTTPTSAPMKIAGFPMMPSGMVSDLVQTFEPIHTAVSATASELDRPVPSGPPAAVPPSLRPHFIVPPKPLSSAPSSTKTNVSHQSQRSRSPRHSRTSSDSALEVVHEAGFSRNTPTPPFQPHVYKNELFQSKGQSREQSRANSGRMSSPLSKSMCAAADRGHTYPADCTSIKTVNKSPGTTAAAFYRSPISSAPVIHSVHASSDSFCTLSGGFGSSGMRESEPSSLLAPQPEEEEEAFELAAHSNTSLDDNPMEDKNTTEGADGGSGSSLLQSSSNLYITTISAGVQGLNGGDIEQRSPQQRSPISQHTLP